MAIGYISSKNSFFSSSGYTFHLFKINLFVVKFKNLGASCYNSTLLELSPFVIKQVILGSIGYSLQLFPKSSLVTKNSIFGSNGNRLYPLEKFHFVTKNPIFARVELFYVKDRQYMPFCYQTCDIRRSEWQLVISPRKIRFSLRVVIRFISSK